MNAANILVVDDEPQIRRVMRSTLSAQGYVITEAKTGEEALESVRKQRPDLVLLDVGMPLLNGLDAGRELIRLIPRIKLIFLTMNPDSELAGEALRIGALGYLLKNSRQEELLEAVRSALHGTTYVTPQIKHAMEKSFIRDPKSLNRPRHLSDRQRQVLQLLAEGRSMKEIAYILQITNRTVHFHKYRIMEELGLTNNAELVQYAIKHSIISPP